MNPLSPFTYYRRHKRGAMLLVGLTALATLSVCVMVRLLDSVVEQSETADRYLSRFSVVSAVGPTLEPGVVSQIRAHPDVAYAVPERGLYIDVPTIGTLPGSFRLFGVHQADLGALMDVCDMRLSEGRLLHPSRNELLLSQELADALGLRVGDRIGRSIDQDRYWAIPMPMVLVGVLETDPSNAPNAGAGTPGSAKVRRQGVLLGFISSEYIESHELFSLWSSSLIVVAHDGRKMAVDDFLENTVASPRTQVTTYRQSSALLAQALRVMHLIFGIVDCVVAIVIAVVVVTVNRIALTQRMEEFGLLRALGHSRHRLTRRLSGEMLVVAGAGWIGGLALSWLAFAWLKDTLYSASMELDLADLTPIWFAAPVPIAVVVSTAWTAARTFAQLDAVAVVERGRMSVEASGKQRVAKRSPARPLSSWTFYLRHHRRGLALTVTMALMILGVAFPALLLSPMVDANRLFIEHLRRLSIVWPRVSRSIDAGVTAQVRTHPAVARVIPAVQVWMMIEVPPLNRTTIRLYGVSEEDTQFLVDLYGVELEEGHLPHPRSNEVVLSKAIAMNRGLQVGDKIGRPVYEYDIRIPTEMVVAGILSRPMRDGSESDLWTGFASYEYLQSHELYASNSVSLLVVPTDGRKAELDAWLAEEIASQETGVRTYEAQLREHQSSIRMMLLLFGVVESVVAVVAAIALAILSFTFFAQRREEFGILHAMGYGRGWIVWRTVAEAVAVVVVAWLIGAAVCIVGLLTMQAGLYAPRGLRLDLLNPAPWLFTLPMPAAVVAVSACLVAWMLSRLDPVSIVERR